MIDPLALPNYIGAFVVREPFIGKMNNINLV